jgi:acetyl esterase/lipase
MKKQIFFLLMFNLVQIIQAQTKINLPFEKSETVQWVGEEIEYFSKPWNSNAVSNVSAPTMEVFRPDPAISNGTSVIVAPGGGMYALAMENEGYNVAKWLVKNGITAFVLRYRLIPVSGNAHDKWDNDGENRKVEAKKVLPLAANDGLSAISYLRNNAKEYNLDPNKIGFMGFSAGGAVTMALMFKSSKKNTPNFIVPVYAWMTIIPTYEVPQHAPPMFVACASDDRLAPGSVSLYSAWLKAEKIAELHMYSKGRHGFGMQKKNLSSDNWIQHFYDWSVTENLTVPIK